MDEGREAKRKRPFDLDNYCWPIAAALVEPQQRGSVALAIERAYRLGLRHGRKR
jgi:hypothetical protein